MSITSKAQNLANLLATLCPDPVARHALFRMGGVQIGKDSYINMQVRFILALDQDARVVIGDRVAIAPGVILVASSGPNSSRLIKDFPYENKTIVIDDDAWIGANAVILPGVRIGCMAVVAAGAVVTGSVEPGTIVGGVPAKPMGRVASYAADHDSEGRG